MENMKKTLRCKLGLHKWMKHWNEQHETDLFGICMVGGTILGIFGMVIAFVTINSPSQASSVALIALLAPPAIGFLIGCFGGTIQDKSCISCHKHSFAYTKWRAKQKRLRVERKKLERVAEEDYKETKQFLKG